MVLKINQIANRYNQQRIFFQENVPKKFVEAIKQYEGPLNKMAQKNKRQVTIGYRFVPANYFAEINALNIGKRKLPEQDVEALYINVANKTKRLNAKDLKLNEDNNYVDNDVYWKVLSSLSE